LKNIAIFASGSGTNAENIIKYFRNHPEVRVKILLSNKKDAYALTRAEKLNVETYVFNRQELYESDYIIKKLTDLNIELIVLAGFLWLIPENLIAAFPNKIINIHPALLPKYGGKGMYGSRVHESVIRAGEKESGITIHFVNPVYDDGQIIFQAKCPVSPDDNAESLAAKVHELEYRHFPKVIENLIII
jgi:phosphoribosylglycinamide formyltransferase-1